MSRLPNPGGDDGTWGTVLNDFLAQAHNVDGTLKATAVGSSGALLASNNLSDLTTVATARTNLGLGGAATLNVGTAAGTVAAGDDSRITGALQPGAAAGGDLSGTLPSPTVAKINGVAITGTPAVGQVPIATSPTAAVWGKPAASGLPPYAPANLLNTYDPSRNVYNWKASNTRRLRAGLGAAARGGMSQHIVVSDSSGAGCTNGVSAPALFDRLNAWPLQARDELARHGIPTSGTGIIRWVDGPTLDARCSATGTWSGAFAYTYTFTNNSTLICTPNLSGTAVDVWYYDSTGSTFTVSVGGAVSGPGFASVAAGSTNTWKKITLLGLTITANTTTVVITKTGAALSIFSGVNIYTPNSGLIMHNASQSGAKASGTGTQSWADNTQLGLVYQLIGGQRRTITDAATTSGSATITSASQAQFSQMDVGKPLSMAAPSSGLALFPAGTYITAVASATSATMSNNATATTTGQTVFIDNDPACIHISLGGNDHPVSTTPIATITAAITTIRNFWPNSDCILYFEPQENSATLITDANWEAYGAALYTLADTLDVPLIDVRDRFGNYNTAVSNGLYGDNQAHFVSAGYSDWGRNVGMIMAN